MTDYGKQYEEQWNLNTNKSEEEKKGNNNKDEEQKGSNSPTKEWTTSNIWHPATAHQQNMMWMRDLTRQPQALSAGELEKRMRTRSQT